MERIMKRGHRPKPLVTKHTPPLARIVTDVRNADSDTFIPLVEAQKLYNEGKLAKLFDIGQGFQPAFAPVRKEDRQT